MKNSHKPLSSALGQPRLLVGIFLVVVVGFVGLLYAAMLNQQKRSQLSEILTTQTVETTPAPDSSPTTSPLPEIVDEAKDGIYTNYTYGFSFEYDDEFFVNHTDSSNKEGRVSLTTSNSDYLPELSIFFPVFIPIDKYSQPYTQEYEACTSLPLEEETTEGRLANGFVTKIYQSNMSCLVASRPNINNDGVEPIWSYLAYLEINRAYVVLGVSFDNEQEFKEYHSRFFGIVNSLRLVE